MVIIAGLAFMVYNNLIRLRNSVTRAWSNIDVLLEKRYELIPNLVRIVRGYAQYEKTVLADLARMRASWDDIKGSGMKDKMDTSNDMTATLKTLFARAENYPDLKADKEFVEVQNELAEIENEIADSREFYNDSVKIYNTSIAVVPYSMFARLLGYGALPYFEAEVDGKRAVGAE